MKGLSWHLRALLYRAAIRCARFLPAGPRRSCRLTVLKLDRLGDAALSLGAIRRLTRDLPPQATLLIVSPVAEELFRAQFPGTPLLVLPAFSNRFWPDLVTFLWRHAGDLRGISTELLVCLRHQPSDYLHVIARLIDPVRTHATEWLGECGSVALTFPRATRVPYPQNRGAANLELEAHRRVVASALAQEVTLQEVLPALPWITPHPGPLLVCPAAGSPIREYPPAMLAAALQQFTQRQPLPVQFCLPPGTDPQPWQLALAAAGVPCQHWHQPATLSALLQLLADAKLVLAPESAPAHLVTAMDRPGVFLLGGGHFGMFAPWAQSRRQIWLHHRVACYQCRWQCIHPEPYCITRIAPAAVADALEQALRES